MQKTLSRPVAPRNGFTIIEIMVVVVIIAILAGLLLTALGGARETARVFEVQADMKKLAAGLENFKMRFGVHPPSSVTLYEAPADWGTDPRSRGIISRIWPRFRFDVTRELDGATGASGSVSLDGAECLVFFLGGVVDLDATQVVGDPRRGSGAFIGFSKDPANPLKRDANPTSSRDGPFYEFGGAFDPDTSPPTPLALGRLVDVNKNNYLELIDTLPSQQTPYLYFSSNGGSGYRASDNTGRIAGPYYIDAAGRNPYNADSFQIISPGFDGSYGSGGQYQKDSASSLNQNDSDNITNFHTGLLKDA